MVKVLHIITGLSTGGAERALSNLLAGGLAKHSNSQVVSLQDEGTFGAPIRGLGVPLHTLGMRRGVPSLRAVFALRRIVSGMRPDVIQGWLYHGNLAATLATQLALGTSVLAWNIRHGIYGRPEELPLIRQVRRARFFSRLPRAIVYNASSSRRQHEGLGFCAASGRVIPNGFDTQLLKPRAGQKESSRQQLNLPLDAVVVGHVARFHPVKDHASFLKTAVEVAGHVAKVHFLLAGQEVHPGNPALAGIIPAGLQRRFHFLGERRDVHALMQAMDVFVSSSAWAEGFPNVLGEAMACGVPCVATDLGDNSVILGAAGVVVPPSDTQALTTGVMSLINQSPAAREALGQSARARIEAHYALPLVANQYRELYESLISRPNKSL